MDGRKTGINQDKTTASPSSAETQTALHSTEAESCQSQNIAAAAKHARNVLLLFLGFLVYWCLTIIDVSDHRIILDKTVRLPLLELELGRDLYFILTPLLAILIYTYLQLSIYQVTSLLSGLKINNSSPEKVYLYPWMLNLSETSESGFFDFIQRFFTWLFLWASLPMVMLFNAFWYLRTHELFLSHIVGATAALGSLVVFCFWRRHGKSRRKRSILKWFARWGIIALVLMIEVCLFLYFIPNAQKGNIPGKFGQNPLGRSLVRLVRIDLSHQRLVSEPSVEYHGSFLEDFKRVRLEGAILQNTVLKRADLRGAHLRGAKMQYSVLEDADLRFSDLRYSNLICAKAARADFSGAQMRTIFLRDADLKGACFRRANMVHARMAYADLRGAELALANMENAILFHSNLQEADLWEANLRNCKLIKADLLNANLKDADLQGARFWNTNLQGANLEGAVLMDAIDLDITQLSQARTLYQAKLDPELFGQIKERFPQLLERPQQDDKPSRIERKQQ